MKKIFQKIFKKKKHSIFSLKFSKNFKISFIVILFFFIVFVEIYLSKFDSLDQEIIIESNSLKNLDEIKMKTTNPTEQKILQEINVIKHIYAKRIEAYKKGKSIIHITESLDNNHDYKFITLVSLFSVLLNCNKTKTFVIFHILVTPDFNESSVTIFKSLFKKFSHNLELIIYNMGNHFLNRKTERYPQAAFYRVLTPLFIDSDRIIHLDGETMTFSDLNEMFTLDFNDNYILGFYDVIAHGVDNLGIKSSIYINSGVILLNLKKIREDNKTIELFNVANSNNTKLPNVDQTLLNYILYPKIGRLPCKFGTWNFADRDDIELYLSKLRTKVPIEELEEGIKNPGIVHSCLCYPKIWSNKTKYTKGLSNCDKRHDCSCKKYFDLWHSFANQTDYYEEILNFTGTMN